MPYAHPLTDNQGAGPVGDGEPAPGSEDRGGEPDGRQVTLADLAQADRDAQLPGPQIGLVGVGHHRRVAQRGGLDRVLVAEVRADQQPGGGGKVPGPGDAVPDEVVVVVERAVQVPVPGTEAVEGVPQQPAGLLVVEVRDAVDERLARVEPRAASSPGTKSLTMTRRGSGAEGEVACRIRPAVPVTTTAGRAAGWR